MLIRPCLKIKVHLLDQLVQGLAQTFFLSERLICIGPLNTVPRCLQFFQPVLQGSIHLQVHPPTPSLIVQLPSHV